MSCWPFVDYFNVADELDGGLSLDELEPSFISAARLGALAFDLPWPPDLEAANSISRVSPDIDNKQICCAWFALCDHAAIGVVEHPVLGPVPVCARCSTKHELEVVT